MANIIAVLIAPIVGCAPIFTEPPAPKSVYSETTKIKEVMTFDFSSGTFTLLNIDGKECLRTPQKKVWEFGKILHATEQDDTLVVVSAKQVYKYVNNSEFKAIFSLGAQEIKEGKDGFYPITTDSTFTGIFDQHELKVYPYPYKEGEKFLQMFNGNKIVVVTVEGIHRIYTIGLLKEKGEYITRKKEDE